MNIILSIDQDITARIDIVTPGHLENYDRKTLEATCEFLLMFCNVIICQAEINLQSTNVYKARSVKIHPLYVKNKRDQNDIALIETSKSFDFSDKEKVSPICLPSK